MKIASPGCKSTVYLGTQLGVSMVSTPSPSECREANVSGVTSGIGPIRQLGEEEEGEKEEE